MRSADVRELEDGGGRGRHGENHLRRPVSGEGLSLATGKIGLFRPRVVYERGGSLPMGVGGRPERTPESS